MKGWSGFQQKSSPAKLNTAFKQAQTQQQQTEMATPKEWPLPENKAELLFTEELFEPTKDKPGSLYLASDNSPNPELNTSGDAYGIGGLDMDTLYKVVYADDFDHSTEETDAWTWTVNNETKTITLTGNAPADSETGEYK
jgi:hypothetical protein